MTIATLPMKRLLKAALQGCLPTLLGPETSAIAQTSRLCPHVYVCHAKKRGVAVRDPQSMRMNNMEPSSEHDVIFLLRDGENPRKLRENLPLHNAKFCFSLALDTIYSTYECEVALVLSACIPFLLWMVSMSYMSEVGYVTRHVNDRITRHALHGCVNADI